MEAAAIAPAQALLLPHAQGVHHASAGCMADYLGRPPPTASWQGLHTAVMTPTVAPLCACGGHHSATASHGLQKQAGVATMPEHHERRGRAIDLAAISPAQAGCGRQQRAVSGGIPFIGIRRALIRLGRRRIPYWEINIGGPVHERTSATIGHETRIHKCYVA